MSCTVGYHFCISWIKGTRGISVPWPFCSALFIYILAFSSMRSLGRLGILTEVWCQKFASLFHWWRGEFRTEPLTISIILIEKVSLLESLVSTAILSSNLVDVYCCKGVSLVVCMDDLSF